MFHRRDNDSDNRSKHFIDAGFIAKPSSMLYDSIATVATIGEDGARNDSVKRRLFFSKTSLRFWTIERRITSSSSAVSSPLSSLSTLKVTKQQKLLHNSENSNYGDQLRFIKEERHVHRRRIYENSLRNSEHNLHKMHLNCTSDESDKKQLSFRQMSEPNVNMIKDRMSHESYVKFFEKTNRYLKNANDSEIFQSTSNDGERGNEEGSLTEGGKGLNDDSKSKWKKWMNHQPISVLRLDKTERLVLKIGDERDAIQKKTFTKWVNKHLGKTGRHVEDLFVDLTDGFNLIALLEALSDEHLPRENGYTRFHRIQNVQYCLDFLKKQNIKTVNIRPEDIVEGNSKLTLGLIWTIILNFQVSVIKQRQQDGSNQISEALSSTDGLSARDALLQWAQDVTRGYPGVNVRNFTGSWRDGLAFNAIMHRYRPNLIQWSKICDEKVSARDRLNNAFTAAETEFGVSRLLDAEDVDVEQPDEKSIITYVSSLYNALPHSSELHKYEDEMYEYEREASEWLRWVQRLTRHIEERPVPSSIGELRRLEREIERLKVEELPPKLREKQCLAEQYTELNHLFERTEHLRIAPELSAQNMDRAWQRLLRSLTEHFTVVEERASVQGSTTDIISRLTRGIGITNEKLDHILIRIDDTETRIETSRPSELQRVVDVILDDLVVLESPISSFFSDVDQLKELKHPQTNDFNRQVYGLEQRRNAYITRLKTQFLTRIEARSETLIREAEQRHHSARRANFGRVEECIQWTRTRLEKLIEMEFVEDLEHLEAMFEQHKVDNHEIQDFRQNVDECIARQAEVSADDTHDYCDLLSTLESEYQQLRDLSAGRMLDLDTLIAFIRGAQHEIVWINEREDIEVARNWSDITQLDLPMLQNYYKQLLHEIELRESRFNEVHNQGAALLNQGHPAIHVIEFYLNSMQRKWEWLLSLSKCLERHLRDALNLRSFTEDVSAAEDWMIKQKSVLEQRFERSDFSLDEGEQLLRELDEMGELIRSYSSMLAGLNDRVAQISPLWQRGEQIQRPIPVTALADYVNRKIKIKEGDECVLVDNSNLIHWMVRGVDATEATLPSVIFRIPPPDARLLGYLNRLHGILEKQRRLWEKKHSYVRYNMVLNTMAQIRKWDLETFVALSPDERDAVIKALNEDGQKLLSEVEPGDNLAKRLKDELKLTNEHFYELLRQMNRPREPEVGAKFDEKVADLLKKLNEAHKKLTDRVTEKVPKSSEELERLTREHKDFEDGLQTMDVDVSIVKELYRQVPNPTPTQRSNIDYLTARWEDLWELSRMYVECMKTLEMVLNGLNEVSDLVRHHEVALSSFDSLPVALDRLRGVHAQLLEFNMVLQQQQSIVDSLNRNVALLRQHTSRTRQFSNHPDVDRFEDEVQMLTVRWENVCSQVVDRLKSVEQSLQSQMAYRSEYDNEIAWLERVEGTLNSLRNPEELRPEQYQHQFDLLAVEYTQLQERTEAVENVNREGGKFIREAKSYDNRLVQYMENVVKIHGGSIRDQFRRSVPQPKSGAEQVAEELENLNKRFARLSSLILERRNTIQVFIQNWKRKKQEDLQNECLERQLSMAKFLETINRMSSAVSEKFSTVTADDATVASAEMEVLRNELLAYDPQVREHIEEADRLCAVGADILTPEQFHALKNHRNRLEATFNELVSHADVILARLNGLAKLLLEFSSESSSMHSFVNEKTRDISAIRAESGDPSVMQKSRQKATALLDEAVSADGNLKRICLLANRIQSEIDEYVIEMRVQYPNAQLSSIDSLQLSDTVGGLQTGHQILLQNCHSLLAFLSRLESLAYSCEHNLANTADSIASLEDKITSIESFANSSGASTESLQIIDLLTDLEILQKKCLEQTHRIEAASISVVDLSSASVGTDAHERVFRENQNKIDELSRRLKRTQKRVEENLDFWRSRLAKNEGIREGFDKVTSWLEEQSARYSQPFVISLYLDNLIELRHDRELAQRELLSREKLLSELTEELKKMVPFGKDSITYRDMLRRCAEAQKKFSSLSNTLKEQVENISELLKALSTINDSEKTINEKLAAIGDKIFHASPADSTMLLAISGDLERLTSNEYSELALKCSWILSVPNVVDDEGLREKLERIDKQLNNLKGKTDELQSRGTNLALQRNDYEEYRDRLVSWIEDFEKQSQGVQNLTLNPVDLAEQTVRCQQLLTEHQNRGQYFDELNEIGSKLLEMEVIARSKSKLSTTTCLPNQAQKTMREIGVMHQRYDALSLLVKTANERINATSKHLSEWDLSRDDFSRWIDSELKRLALECQVDFDIDVVQSNISKAEHLQIVYEKSKKPLLKEIRNEMQLLLKDPSVVGSAEIKDAQRALENAWAELLNALQLIKQKNNAAKQLLDDSLELNKWLKQKERMISAMSAVNVDPKVIDNQIIQLQILQTELEEHCELRDKINETAHNLITDASSQESRRQIIEKVDELNHRWMAFQEDLATKISKLHRVKDASSNFCTAHRNIRTLLLSLAEEIECMSRSPLKSKLDIEQQMSNLNALGEKTQVIDGHLSDLRKICEDVCELSDDRTLQSDVREQLNTVVQYGQEMCKKIDSLKSAALSAKEHEGKTVEEVDLVLKWIKNAEQLLKEVGVLSAEKNELIDQRKVIHSIYQSALEREGDVVLLRAKLVDQMKDSDGASNVQPIIDALNAAWNPFLDKVKTKKGSADRVADLVQELDNLLAEFSTRLEKNRADVETMLSEKQSSEAHNISDLEREVEAQGFELTSMKKLIDKVEEIAGGPFLIKLRKDVENAAEDWKSLSRYAKKAMSKAEHVKNVRSRILKYKEEAKELLNAALEAVNDLQKTDKKIPTRESLLRTIEDLEESWGEKECGLAAILRDSKVSLNTDEMSNFGEDLRTEFSDALNKLRQFCDMLGINEVSAENVKQKIENLNDQFSSEFMEERTKVARDLPALNKQSIECEILFKKLDEKQKVLDELIIEWNDACQNGVTSVLLKNQISKQIMEIGEKIKRQKSSVTQRASVIKKMQLELEELECQSKVLNDEVNELCNEDAINEPPEQELGQLRMQQNKLSTICTKVRLLEPKVMSHLKTCEKLVHSASEGVSTAHLQRQKDTLSERWNAMSEAVSGSEKQIFASLQELGNYNDTCNSLLIWLQDTEESLANQRPPSIEYRVVKEQLQANEILLKHVEEKQQSFDAFKLMIEKVVVLTTDNAGNGNLKEQANGLAKRYQALLQSVYDRRSCLQQAIVLTQEWGQIAEPFEKWLEVTEHFLQQLGRVPTDENKLLEQISAYHELQNGIDGKSSDAKKIGELFPLLLELTSDVEAAQLESTFRTYLNRYENLCLKAPQCGILLKQIGKEISTFLERTNTLSEWLDRVESDVDKVEHLSIYPEELIEQSSLLTELAMAVTEGGSLVSTVVEDGRELCRQTTGDEAIALQSRIEALRTRYGDLASVTETKIATLSEVLPLSERFHDGCEAILQCMDVMEQELQCIDEAPLESRSALIMQMEEELGKLRPDVDEINSLSKQLKHLSSGSRVFELEAQSDELTLKFDQLLEQVACRADKLTSAERHSRHVLDELEYLNDWFSDVHERLVHSCAPAVDPDYVQKQLKNQKQMNDDIVVMKARFREATAEAQKVARSLGDDFSAQNSFLANKIESGRALSANVTRLSEDRFGELEQALVLSKEVDQSFGELHVWLELLEGEIANCSAISTRQQRDELMQQQKHNMELQNSILLNRPLLDRFNRNVAALSDLCDSEDEVQIRKIADSLMERFEVARTAVQERGEALETAIAHSSKLSDRLDALLANFDDTAMKVRNYEPMMADPERIRSQIIDNCALMDELRRREGVLRLVKESAEEILSHAKPNDSAAAEVSAKLDCLDILWQELIDGVTVRGNVLEETLNKAECFWSELQICQQAVESLRSRIIDLEAAAGQPSIIKEQQGALGAIEKEIRDTHPAMMAHLRATGSELCKSVVDTEKTNVEQQINCVEEGWNTITDICVHKSVDLVEAMDKAMNYHGLLSELQNRLTNAEAKVSKFLPISSSSPADIENELVLLSDLRSLLDEKALEKEQLNQLCGNLCVDISAQQSSIIRSPINDLNLRWNRLYSSLNDRQQKMEKLLLEMGQFSQAYEQLMNWIEKTDLVLNEINPRPNSVKQIEVEVCKHHVLQNDVVVHESSIETLNNAAKLMITADPHSAVSLQRKIDTLNARWHIILDKLENVWDQLNDARKAAENLGAEMEMWALWLQDKDADLSHSRPTGGLPETAQAQLDDFYVIKAEIEQNRAAIDSHFQAADNYLSDGESDKNTWIKQRAAHLRKKWLQVQDKMFDRERKLKIALEEAEQLHASILEINDWLTVAESRLGSLEQASRFLEVLEKQRNEHDNFHAEIISKRELMSDLSNKGTKLQYYCEKKDAIPIKNILVSAKHRFDKVISRTADRAKQLDCALQEAKFYFDSHANLISWLDSNSEWINDQAVQTTSGDRLQKELERHKTFQREFSERLPMFESTIARGKTMVEHAPRSEKGNIEQLNETLHDKWTGLYKSATRRQRSVEDSLMECGQFDETLSSLHEWLAKELPHLQEVEGERVHGDLETVSTLVSAHNDLKAEIATRHELMESIRLRSDQLLNGKELEDSAVTLKNRVEKLDVDWLLLEKMAISREERLQSALAEATSFDTSMHSFLDWLSRIETRLRSKSQAAENEVNILEQMDEVAQLRSEMDDEEERMLALKSNCHEIKSKCHPYAEQPLKYWLKVLQNRWEQVSGLIDNKRDDLNKQLGELRTRDKMVSDLNKFIAEKNSELKVLSESALPRDKEEINRLMETHENFEESLRQKQSQVDEATKGNRKTAEEVVSKKNNTKIATNKRGSAMRNPKSEQLSDRWKKLWINSMDFGRRLREMKDYIDEMKRLESFSFEAWRERYLNWTDAGKSRISDLFRRIDKTGAGHVPRAAFIDGIIASKFPTTRLEMEKVADVFDHGNGMIDAKEFMSRLRFDFSRKLTMKPKSDIDKITEEVLRQAERCNCRSPYRIQKVGENHYRFGETQIKRMVRILRSTVMVRVGGGWVALEEFLHKHDPCRAKGRTNLDLRRNFYDDVRPKGAFDTMETFTKSNRTTPVRDSRVLDFSEPLLSSRFQTTPGPITKIREKTERSMPMHFSRRVSNTRASPSDTASRSSRHPSDLTSVDTKASRSNTSGTFSRSGSRDGDLLDLSRPVSRNSDVSECDRPTRIPSLRGRKGMSYRSSPAKPGTSS